MAQGAAPRSALRAWQPGAPCTASPDPERSRSRSGCVRAPGILPNLKVSPGQSRPLSLMRACHWNCFILMRVSGAGGSWGREARAPGSTLSQARLGLLWPLVTCLQAVSRRKCHFQRPPWIAPPAVSHAGFLNTKCMSHSQRPDRKARWLTRFCSACVSRGSETPVQARGKRSLPDALLIKGLCPCVPAPPWAAGLRV